MNKLVIFAILISLFGCGEVEEKKPGITKAGADVTPGTGLPLVSAELKDKIKVMTEEVHNFEDSLRSSEVIEVKLPGDTVLDNYTLSENGQKFETAVMNAMVSEKCLSILSPSPDLIGDNPDSIRYELRITDSSQLNECPIYFYNNVFFDQRPSLNQKLKGSTFNVVVEPTLPLYEAIDVTEYINDMTSTFTEPPQNSNLVYESALFAEQKGYFVSKAEGKVSFRIQKTQSVSRNNSSGQKVLTSKSAHTVELNLKDDVQVIGYSELQLVDKNGETTVTDSYFINGEEISKEAFKLMFTFGSR